MNRKDCKIKKKDSIFSPQSALCVLYGSNTNCDYFPIHRFL